MATRVDLVNLCKYFPARKGSGERIARAVESVNLTIEPGELFFLLGPSGCGKTTLLRMIAGFIMPTKGSILFDKQDVAPFPPNKRATGMVFQSYALWPHMSVEQNVAYGLKLRKVSAAERADRVHDALQAVEMAQYAKRKPAQLSGGQQQRVALARALVIRPAVLLLDEPLSNLDAKLRIQLREEIRNICKSSGLTTIYVTHDQKEALSMADRVAIMRDGRVVQVGPPAECYRKPADTFVASFLGETTFLKASLSEARGEEATALTAAGPLKTRIPKTDTGAPVFTSNDDIVVSIRPEAVRLVEPGAPGALKARRLAFTHMGELGRHKLRLFTKDGHTEGPDLLAHDINPLATRAGDVPVSLDADAEAAAARKATVGVAVDPADVVLLPADRDEERPRANPQA